MTLFLLNTRSLRKHAQDIAKDENLMDNDVLSLTEVQICQENDVPRIKQQSDTYKLHLNLEGDGYQNIEFCLLKSIKITKHEKLPGVSILEIIKDSFHTNIIRILLLYRSPNSSLTIFYNRLELFNKTCSVGM